MSGKAQYTNRQFGKVYLKKGGGISHPHLVREMLRVVMGLRLQGKTEEEIIKLLEGEIID